MTLIEYIKEIAGIVCILVLFASVALFPYLFCQLFLPGHSAVETKRKKKSKRKRYMPYQHAGVKR